MKLQIEWYKVEMINGQPKIVIDRIRQMDDDGKFVKWLSMKDAVKILAISDVTWKPLSEQPF